MGTLAAAPRLARLGAPTPAGGSRHPLSLATSVVERASSGAKWSRYSGRYIGFSGPIHRFQNMREKACTYGNAVRSVLDEKSQEIEPHATRWCVVLVAALTASLTH